MPDGKAQTANAASEAAHAPLLHRALDWARHFWRPAGTVVAIALALLFGWGVANGKHGLSAWEMQRSQDKQLQRQIKELLEENAHLREHVEHLKSDPDSIEHEAREHLHYARPGEVIYTLPAQQQAPAPPENAK